MTLRRTTVYVERLEGHDVICTPAGVAGPRGSASIDLDDFPDALRDSIEAGRVFFAYVDLKAEPPEHVRVERIEDRWGDTGPLHFDVSTPASHDANYVQNLLKSRSFQMTNDVQEQCNYNGPFHDYNCDCACSQVQQPETNGDTASRLAEENNHLKAQNEELENSIVGYMESLNGYTNLYSFLIHTLRAIAICGSKDPTVFQAIALVALDATETKTKAND